MNEITTRRLILAAIAGGIILFVWGAVAWMVLPMDRLIRKLPDEKSVVASMQTARAERGVYFVGGNPAAPGPQMLMVYTPFAKALSPGQLGREFLTDLIAAFVMAWLLSRVVAKTFPARLVFVIVAGAVLAAIVDDLANWNWFAYPVNYTLAHVGDRLIGWALAGLALAAIVRPRPAAPVTA
jgi:hypothetical protein